MAPEYKPDWTVNHGVELYDHQTDPEENWNQADNPEYKKEVEKLSKLLREGWRNVPVEDYVYEPPTKKTAANRALTIHSYTMQMTVTYVIFLNMFIR